MARVTTSGNIVIVGSGGRLGAALHRGFGQKAIGFSRADLDLARPGEISRRLDPLEFGVVINCAAQTNVDRCETEKAEAFRINAEAPGELAALCREKGARLVHISTDYVFDGEKTTPYTEEDEARPLSVYGESKRAGEEAVLAQDPRHVVARVSWVFGPDRPSFVDAMIERALASEKVEAIADKFSTPSYTIDLAGMLAAVLDHPEAAGLLHLANDGACSWQEYAQWALDCCVREGFPLKTRTVEPLRLADLRAFKARRPVYTVLATKKFQGLTGMQPRPWREAVAEYVARLPRKS